MEIEPSYLSLLFERIAAAADHGRFADALRLADSARRFAPDHPAVVLLHGRLALQTGDTARAATCVRGRDDPDSLLLSADAARRAGWLDEAGAACRQLLARFAVDSIPQLPALLGNLCRDDARLAGWVGLDSTLRLVGACSTGRTVSVALDDSPVETIAAAMAVASDAAAPAAFAAAVASRAAGTLRVRAGDQELLGSGLAWPPNFDLAGWVVLEGEELHGEVCLNWNRRSALTLLIACGSAERRITVAPPGPDCATSSFSVPVAAFRSGGPYLEVSAALPDGSTVPLAGSPIKLPQPAPLPVAEFPAAPRRARRAGLALPRINIVVPVYRGFEETLACLRSVLATAPSEFATVTVVDDASPEAPLREALKLLADTGGIKLLRNTCNLGFPGAANRGMRLHRNRDVVLLNADTEVFPGWLERLRAAAYAEERIGTVTPLGEAASVMNYQGGAPTSQAEAAAIARIAALVNSGQAVDLPVGVGFCLYLRRECLDEVGDFDELGFGKGYGEENDFCLRARARGWRHVGAADVFVRHLGARSFGRAKELLQARNGRVINYRYPGYDAMIAQFGAANPLLGPKRSIDAARLLEAARRPVLLVSHALSGGVKRHVEERRRALADAGHTVLTLHAVQRGSSDDAPNPLRGRAVLGSADLHLPHLHYDLSGEVADLRALLVRLDPVAIEFHHFLGLPGPALEMLAGLGAPYRVFVHDYAWICPRVSLLNGSGVYCGEPAAAECDRCVAAHGMAWEEALTVAELRARSAQILASAERVIAPSQDVAARLARYFPALTIEVTPWEAPPQARVPAGARVRRKPGERVRVALMGAINTLKGWQVLRDCARDAAARDLPLEFVIIGHSSNNPPLLETGRVFLTGPYQEDEAAALLEREHCDVALFPTVGPETWCYTLTHVLAHNIPIVAFDLGAVAERLRAAGTGLLLSPATPPAAINDALQRAAAIAGAPEPLGVAPDRSLNDPLRSDAKSMQPIVSSEAEAESAAPELAATVQVLTLPPGLYAFTVQSGTARAAEGLAVPALHVAPAPMRSAGTLEFLCGPATFDRWLTGSGDVVTVKITGGDATLLLTSVRAPQSAVLAIDVRRLDAVDAPVQFAAESPAPTPVETRVLTLVHVPYLGDLTFVEGWAGRPSENLWIEGFSILVEEPSDPDLLEYRGVTEEGEATPWMSAGEFCGTRGTGIPLVAFAVRVNPAARALYSCAYTGQFLSGTVIGPFSDGRLCSSESPGDPLVAIELRLEADRLAAGSTLP